MIRYAQLGQRPTSSPAGSCGSATTAPSARTPARARPSRASSWLRPGATRSPASTPRRSPAGCTARRPSPGAAGGRLRGHARRPARRLTRSAQRAGDQRDPTHLRAVRVIHWLGVGVVRRGRRAHRRHAGQHVLDDLAGARRRAASGCRATRRSASRSGRAPAPSGRPSPNRRPARYRDCDARSRSAPAPLPLRRWFVHYSHHDGHDRAGAWRQCSTTSSRRPVRTCRSARRSGCSAPSPASSSCTASPSPSSSACASPTSTTRTRLLSDWLFLGFLWPIGVSGFVLELADYVPLGELGRHRLPRPRGPGDGADPAAAVHQVRAHRLPPARHLVHGVPAVACDESD